MNRQRVSGFDASIAALVKRNPGLAFSRVPSSFTSYYGESLGWPDWLLEGTDFAGQQSIPRELPLVDGLKAMANLLIRLGEAKLAEMMLEWPRFPLEAEALAAPDLETALRSLIARVEDRNPTFEFTMAEQNGALVVRIGINPDLGAFRALYEQIILIWLFLVIRSFLGMSRGGRDLLVRVAIGRFHSDPATDALLPCQMISAEDAAMLVVPPEALRCAGPDFKSELWAGVLATLESQTMQETAQAPNLGTEISKLAAHALRDRGRVLSFVEIAQAVGRSQRTVARTLAEEGTSYRKIVDDVRMELAKNLLSDSDTTVREIGAQLGYSDDTAFVRAFRRCYGMSPDRWRRNRHRPSKL
jgi:AraC-like DNA-binding protein